MLLSVSILSASAYHTNLPDGPEPIPSITLNLPTVAQKFTEIWIDVSVYDARFNPDGKYGDKNKIPYQNVTISIYENGNLFKVIEAKTEKNGKTIQSIPVFDFKDHALYKVTASTKLSNQTDSASKYFWTFIKDVRN